MKRWPIDGGAIWCGDAVELIRELKTDSVACTVMDPPDYQELLFDVLRVTDGPVIWLGRVGQSFADLRKFDRAPDRVLVWVPDEMPPPNGVTMVYRWHPIYVWQMPQVTSPKMPADVLRHPCATERFDHPGVKPVELFEDLLTLAPDGPVLDPFMGTGSSLVAARRLGRPVIGCDHEEHWCEVARGRLECHAATV